MPGEKGASLVVSVDGWIGRFEDEKPTLTLEKCVGCECRGLKGWTERPVWTERKGRRENAVTRDHEECRVTWTAFQGLRARPVFRANGELRGKTGLQDSRGRPVKKETRAFVYLLPRCFQDLKAIAV